MVIVSHLCEYTKKKNQPVQFQQVNSQVWDGISIELLQTEVQKKRKREA